MSKLVGELLPGKPWKLLYFWILETFRDQQWEVSSWYIQLTHFIVQQKLTQHCKAIIFQLKRNTSKKENAYASVAAATSIHSCPTVRHQRRQPTRLPSPWDSPGKNTGVGCRFLLQSMKVKSQSEVAQSCPTLATPWTAAHQAPPTMGFSRQEYWSGVPLPSPAYAPTLT